MDPITSRNTMDTLRALIQLALPYKKRFAVIALLALLGTGADLVQPLIYRIAINDVAGLFVDPTTVPGVPRAAPTQPDQLTPFVGPLPEPYDARRRQQELDRLQKT